MTPPPSAPDLSLQDMRRHADPLGDGTIARILGDWPAQGWPADDAPQWRRIAEVNRLFGEWADNASLAHWHAPSTVLGQEAAQALTDYVQQAQALPPWADPQKIQRAERLFMEYGAVMHPAVLLQPARVLRAARPCRRAAHGRPVGATHRAPHPLHSGHDLPGHDARWPGCQRRRGHCADPQGAAHPFDHPQPDLARCAPPMPCRPA